LDLIWKDKKEREKEKSSSKKNVSISHEKKGRPLRAAGMTTRSSKRFLRTGGDRKEKPMSDR